MDLQDTAFTNADDYKLTTGYVFLVSEGAINGNQRDNNYRDVLYGIRIRRTLRSRERSLLALGIYIELGFPQMGPTVIKSDNEGSVILSHNPQFNAWTKHIEICHHWSET